jgi:hypothetical protein
MRRSFGEIVYCSTEGNSIQPTEHFLHLLENNTYRLEVEDILHLGDHEFRTHILPHRTDDELILYHKYSRQDVCRLLNWEKDESSTIYGYKVHYSTMTCPIFVTYHKNVEEIDPSINYEDHFITQDTFAWETRHGVKLNSREPKAIRNEFGPLKTLLFVKKNNDEGIAFYYLGEMKFLDNRQGTKVNKQGKSLPVVSMQFTMCNPVAADLYDYITG